jgi:hypothetical protein
MIVLKMYVLFTVAQARNKEGMNLLYACSTWVSEAMYMKLTVCTSPSLTLAFGFISAWSKVKICSGGTN